MNLLVIDLECTMPPIKRTGEIIQIGYALLSIRDTGSKITPYSPIYVLPERTQISKECEELTGISPEMCATMGVPKQTAMGLLSSVCDYDFWGSWGMFDYNKLDEVCFNDNLSFPLSRRKFTNLKPIFSLMSHTGKPFGVKGALSKLGMEFEGKPHDGADDAFNTARIIQHLLTNQ